MQGAICDVYSDGLDPDDIASCLVLWVTQYGCVRREGDNRSSGFRSDNRGELGWVKSTPEGVNEVDTSILDLYPRR